MLMLGRNKGEKIIIKIGDKTVTLVVAEVFKNKVRLGFEADKDIKIIREELL